MNFPLKSETSKRKRSKNIEKGAPSNPLQREAETTEPGAEDDGCVNARANFDFDYFHDAYDFRLYNLRLACAFSVANSPFGSSK